MFRLTLFCAPQCGLCHAARFVIDRVLRDLEGEVVEVDISDPQHAHWRACYGEHIPVIHLNGQEIFRHRLSEKTLRAALRAAAAPGTHSSAAAKRSN